MDDVVGVVRYAVGFTLALAAAWKVKDFSAFGRSLGSYGLHGLSGSAGAAAVIGAEALAAGLCFGGFGGLAVAHTVVTGVAVSSDVMVGVLTATLGICFSVAQTYLLSTGRPAPCLCFGAAASMPVSLRSWSRSVLVLLGGLLLVFVGRPGARPLDPVLVTGGLLLVGGLAVLYRRMPPVAALHNADGR
jgi:hypothetical protein